MGMTKGGVTDANVKFQTPGGEGNSLNPPPVIKEGPQISQQKPRKLSPRQKKRTIGAIGKQGKNKPLPKAGKK